MEDIGKLLKMANKKQISIIIKYYVLEMSRLSLKDENL